MRGRSDISDAPDKSLTRAVRIRAFVTALAAAAIVIAAVAGNPVLTVSGQENDGEDPSPEFNPSGVRVWIEEPIDSSPCGLRLTGGSSGLDASAGQLYLAVKSNLPARVTKWFVQEPAFVNLPDGSWDSPISFTPCELLFFDTFTVCPVLAEGPPISAQAFDARPGTRVGNCAEAPELDWSLPTTSDRGPVGAIVHYMLQQLGKVITAIIVAVVTIVVGVVANRVFNVGRGTG